MEPLLDLRGGDEEADGSLHDEVAHEARARPLARLGDIGIYLGGYSACPLARLVRREGYC